MFSPEGGHIIFMKGTWLEQEGMGRKVVSSNLRASKVFHLLNATFVMYGKSENTFYGRGVISRTSSV